MRVFGR